MLPFTYYIFSDESNIKGKHLLRR